MIKRRYLIIVLAIASVFLASLFYNNITQTQALTTYTGSVKIDLLNIDRRATLSSYIDPPQHKLVDLVLPFVFSPDVQVSNVSDMWITFYADNYGPSPPEAYCWYRINITLNNQVWAETPGFYYDDYALIDDDFPLISVNLDSSFCEAITQGINVIKFSDPYSDKYGPNTMTVLEIIYVAVFIEYEYQTQGVGGFMIPIDKFSLLAPYIALVSTIILAVSISVAYIKYRKKQYF